jgi:hypothetical protein
MGFVLITILFVALVRPVEALTEWSARRGFAARLIVGFWAATALLFVGVALMPAGLLPPNTFFVFLAVPFAAFVSTLALRDARRRTAGLPPIAHVMPEKFGGGQRLAWIFLALLIGAVASGEWYFWRMRVLALGTGAAAFGLLWGGLTGRFPQVFERVFELRHTEPPDSHASP